MSLDAAFDFADEFQSIGDIEPNTDTYRRRVVILLFDLSGSMGVPENGERPVDALNMHLRRWLPVVRERGTGPLREVEFAVVTFAGSTVSVVTPRGMHHLTGRLGPADSWLAGDGGAFMPAASLAIPEFQAHGATPMISAINVAVELGRERARHLAGTGIESGQIRLLLFSDGSPHETGQPVTAWTQLAAQVHELRRQRLFQLFAFGVPSADADALTALAGPGGYHPLERIDFALLLDMILVATSADDPYVALRNITDGDDS